MVTGGKAPRRPGAQSIGARARVIARALSAGRFWLPGRFWPPGRLAAWPPLLGALITLGGCGDDGSRPTTVITLRDSADQVLEGFRHVITANGVRSGDIEADTAYFFDVGQSTILARMKVNFFDSTGQQTGTLTAKRGKYFWQNGNLDAEGDVVMVNQDGRTLKTPRLKLDNVNKKMSSDTIFTYDAGQNHIVGSAFTSDLKFENIETVRPRGVAGEPVLLPGQ